MVQGGRLACQIVGLALVSLLVAGCGSATPEATQPATSAPLDMPTAEPTEATETVAQSAQPVIVLPTPTDTPLHTATEIALATAPTSWSEVATVEGDYYVLGNPAAPIRLVDFSDFL